MATMELLQGCNGTSAGMPVGPATAIVPTVTIAPSPSLAIPAGELPYVVSVSGPSGDATPAGTVVISSGRYASFATTLSTGNSTINIPAGLLATGPNMVTAVYTPTGASVGYYASATGTATVAGPMAATAPTVTTSSVTYPTTGAPFEALVSVTGTVFVGVPSGIQVFTPASGGELVASCVNPLGSTLTSEGGAVSELSLLPGGTTWQRVSRRLERFL